MFKHQFRHEVVGLETKFFWLHLVQQISFMSSTSLINLSDQEPRYQQFRDRFLWCKLLDTFSILKLTRQYITILLQFVLPKMCVERQIIAVYDDSGAHFENGHRIKLQERICEIAKLPVREWAQLNNKSIIPEWTICLPKSMNLGIVPLNGCHSLNFVTPGWLDKSKK